MYIYFLGVSSSRNEEKKMCEKRKKKKKKMVQNWLGYCLTVSQYNGELYRDTAAGRALGWGEGHDTVGCIVTGAEVRLGGAMSQYKELYCDKRTVGWACHNTVGCIMTRKKEARQRLGRDKKSIS